MKINDLQSNDAVSVELGARIRRARIDHPLTQEQLASRAGISKRTIANLEHGEDVTVGSLISVLRALGLLSRMDMLVPEPEVRPSELLAAKEKRQRVRSAQTTADAASWKWGDE